MDRKIQKVIFILLIATLILLAGCKEYKSQRIYSNEKKEETKIFNIFLDSKIADDFIKDFGVEIDRYIVERKNELSETYNISWNQYTIYFKDSSSKYFALDWLISKNLLFKKLSNLSSNYEKYQVFDNIQVSNKEKKLVNNLVLYFPIKIKEKFLDNYPKIAFVVDDVVEDNYWTEELLKFNYTLNIAIIPTRKTEEIAKKIAQKGWEVMMHLPMESISYPKDAKYLVSEAIMVGMNEEEIEEILRTHLNRFGDIKIRWVNNHMGSKVTADTTTMEKLLDIFKKYHLCFLDSKTIKDTVAKKVANKVGVPSLENMLFIDHENTPEKIKHRFVQALNIAKKKGWGIFIFHLRPNTIKVLRELEAENFFSNMRLIKISDLFEEVNTHSLAQLQEPSNKLSH